MESRHGHHNIRPSGSSRILGVFNLKSFIFQIYIYIYIYVILYQEKKLFIVKTAIMFGDLSEPSCTILSEFARLAGASRKQRCQFVAEYRKVTGANYGSLGFIGLPLETGEPLRMLRLFKLTEFYVYLGGEKDNETDPIDF